MIRLAKLTDYGLVLMTIMARQNALGVHTARDLAIAWLLAAQKPRFSIFEIRCSGRGNVSRIFWIISTDPSCEPLSTTMTSKDICRCAASDSKHDFNNLHRFQLMTATVTCGGCD